jgi:hypothetical protein
MADSKKYCTKCFLPAPPDWNQKYCPNCGGRIKLKLVNRRRASQGRSRMPEAAETKKERQRRITPTRKLMKQNSYSPFEAREKSVLGPRFRVMSPTFLFILNLLTLGLRSAFWVVNRMSSLQMMAKLEEKNIKSRVTLWIVSFSTSITLAAIAGFNATTLGLGPDYLAESRMVHAAAASFALSFLLNRHILYWSREVIIDELRQNALDVIRSRAVTFAPSPMSIWFLGVPYIQAHINRMIKKKGLNAYKPSKGARVRKPSHEDREKIAPEPMSGLSEPNIDQPIATIERTQAETASLYL